MATIGVLLKSWFGWVLSIIFLAVSQATAQQWALYASIAAGLATFGYTMYKWGRDVYNDFKIGKRLVWVARIFIPVSKQSAMNTDPKPRPGKVESPKPVKPADGDGR